MKRACLVVALLLWAAPVAAQNSAQKEAGNHFQRAVTLYNEADYRGALVEFKRAYEVSPAVAVLYNIGQTYFQLQDYANALHMFERYLAEGGGPHKAEVEGSVATLRTRVGKIDVTTTAQGCDIAIDDEPVGKSPLPKPVLTGVGRHRVIVACPGVAPAARFTEVAAGETATVNVPTEEPHSGGTTAGSSPAGQERSKAPIIVGWVATGALAVSSIIMGGLAIDASSQLKSARDTYPNDRADLDSKASRATTFSVLADVLGTAAIVAGGVSLYLTLSSSSSGDVKVQASGRDVRLVATF